MDACGLYERYRFKQNIKGSGKFIIRNEIINNAKSTRVLLSCILAT